MSNGDERIPKKPGTERKIDTSRTVERPVRPQHDRSQPVNQPGGDDQGFGPGGRLPDTTTKKTEE